MLYRYGVIAALLAALCNVLIWAIGRLVGVSFRVQPPGQPESTVGVVPIVLFTVVPILIGTVVYALLRGRIRWAYLVFVGLVALVFIALLIPPMASTQETDTRFALLLMHIIAAGAMVLAVTRYERRRVRP